MRKILAITLAGGLLFASLPSSALAGDTHAVRNRWGGVGIGAAAAVVVGSLLNVLQAPFAFAGPPVAYAPPPVEYAPPPVVYAPPPVVYSSPPPAYYGPPPVVYAPPPVVIYGSPRVAYGRPPVVAHRGWGPPGSWDRGHEVHGRDWNRD